METILDLASVFVLKGLLPYSHVLVHKLMDDGKHEPPLGWDLRLSQCQDYGILSLTLPRASSFWSFRIYCPEEWNTMKVFSDHGNIPRNILSVASANTRPQVSVMKSMNIDCPMPAYIDFSSQGINLVIESSLGGPDQNTCDEIKKRLILLLDQEL